MVKKLKKQGSVKKLGDYSFSNTAAMTNTISSTLQVLTLIVSFIAGISLFISGVGVMNMVYHQFQNELKKLEFVEH